MTGQSRQLSEEETFADRLRIAMLNQGVGLGLLSKQTGLTQRQIAKYRQPHGEGGVEPRDYFGKPTPNAHRLAEALGVEVEWLVPPKPSRDSDSAPQAAA